MIKGPLKQSYLPLAIASGSLIYLLYDEFTTADQPPITSPRNAEPGPGQLTFTDTGVRTGLLQSTLFVGPGMGNGDPFIRAANGFARVNGRTFFINKIKRSGVAFASGNPVIGWLTTLSPVSVNNIFGSLWSNGSGGVGSWNVADNGAFPSFHTLMTMVDYVTGSVAIMLDDNGFKFFRNLDNKYTLLWKGYDGTVTPMYPTLYQRSAGDLPFQVDSLIVRDIKATVFNSEYGAATYNITSFTQSLGSELITNGNFSAWTGIYPNRDPDGWTVTNETVVDPEVSEVGSGEGHGGVGTGAANLFSSATANTPRITQTILSIGSIYEITLNVTTVIGGSILVLDTGALIAVNYSTTGIKRIIGRAAGTGFRIQGGTTADVTVDDVTVKAITLNTAQVSTSDAMHDLHITVNPDVAGDEAHLLYRINAPGEELLNCWDAYIRRNATDTAYDFRLDSIAAGVRTNRINVTGITSPNAIRVVVNGSNHACYTRNAGGGWVARTEVNVSLYDAATGVNSISTTGVTINRLVSWPIRSAAYDAAMIVGVAPTYQLKDNFYTSVAAPLSSSRDSEPGAGRMKKHLDSTNLIRISGGKVRGSGTAVVDHTDPAYYWTDNADAGIPRANGRVIIFRGIIINAANTRTLQIGVHNSATPTGGIVAGLDFSTGGVFGARIALFRPFHSTWTVGSSYDFALLEFANGYAWFIRSNLVGERTFWTLLFVHYTGNDATLWLMVQAYGTFDYEIANISIGDLATLTSQNAISFSDQTVFTQSAGAELVTNGGFTNGSGWTADNPNSWTIGGEVGADPEITERAPANTHAGAVGTGDAANFFATATVTNPVASQVILTSGLIYETGFQVTARVSGTLNLVSSGGGNSLSISTTGVKKGLLRSTSTTLQVFSPSSAKDITVDDITVKLLTLNTAQTMPADAVLDFEYTVPASPVAGQEIHLIYKIQIAGAEFLNCWDAYVRRNDGNTSWDFRLDSIAAGVRTNRINVTTVGDTDCIRMICEGLTHDAYTRASAVWTKRGGVISVSGFDNARLANTIYSTGTTPSRFIIYPATGYVDSTPLINITVDGQSLGAELLTDGALENWTSATNATSYTESLSGTSTVNREGTNIHGGSFAARYDIDASNSSASIAQTLVSAVNDWWEISAWVRNSSGAQTFALTSSIDSTGGLAATTSYAQFMGILRSGNSANAAIAPIRISATSGSLYFDDMSVKKITLNQQQVAGADGLFQLDFTLPVSPMANQQIQMRYRIQDELNFWVLRLWRNAANNAWNLNLDSVAAGTATNRIAQAGVGTPNQIRVKAVGNIHVLEYGTSGVWTHSGTINQGVMVGNFGLNYAYNTGFTFGSLKYYPFIKSYDAILEAI